MNDLATAQNQLLRDFCDGCLDQTDFPEFNRLIREDANFFEAYLLHTKTEARLELAMSKDSVSTISFDDAIEQRSTRRKLLFWTNAAAAMLAAAGTTAYFTLWGNSTSARETASAAVATLLYSDDCEWDGKDYSEGQPLNLGTLRLTRGTALVRFVGGTEMLLEEGSSLGLKTGREASLEYGKAMIRSSGDNAFQLRVPGGQLDNEETECSISVDSNGATELEVIDGSVSIRADDSNKTRAVIEAGDSVRLEKASLSKQTKAQRSLRFAEAMSKLKIRATPEKLTAYEGFFYDVGRYPPNELDGGKGWTGPWRLRTESEAVRPGEIESTDAMEIVDGKLNMTWPIRGGKLRMLEIPSGWYYRTRKLAEPIRMDRDGVHYLSLIVHEPARKSVDGKPTKQAASRITLRSSQDYWSDLICLSFGKKLSPLIECGDFGKFGSLSEFGDGQTLLWIAKIVSRRDGEDEISFRVYGEDDEFDVTEPATWHAVSRGVRQNATLDLFMISSGGEGPRVFDEIRIGPTWRSVVPIRSDF